MTPHTPRLSTGQRSRRVDFEFDIFIFGFGQEHQRLFSKIFTWWTLKYLIKMTVFWEVTFYSLVNGHQLFGENRCLNYQSTLVPIYQTTRHAPEVCNLNTNCSQNIRSYSSTCFLWRNSSFLTFFRILTSLTYVDSITYSNQALSFKLICIQNTCRPQKFQICAQWNN